MAVAIVAEMANAATRKGVSTSEWNLIKSAVQWTIDGGKAQRQRDQRQGNEEDRVADDGGPRLAIEAGGGPEGEEAEGGDYRRQPEGRHAQCLDHARPGRPAPPQEPGERSEERRVGKEWGSTCSYRGTPVH